jgi:hypothetical protein
VKHVLSAAEGIHGNEREGNFKVQSVQAGEKLPTMTGSSCPSDSSIYHQIATFRRRHLARKAGGAVYVTMCAQVEEVPQSHQNSMEVVPVICNNGMAEHIQEEATGGIRNVSR